LKIVASKATEILGTIMARRAIRHQGEILKKTGRMRKKVSKSEKERGEVRERHAETFNWRQDVYGFSSRRWNPEKVH
jgi:hypothetical protein